MATYKYVAKDFDANTVSGKIIADTQSEVVDELRKRKLVIISVAEVKEGGLKNFSFESKKVKPDELVIFTRQLATMVDAGIPLLQGLDAMQEQIASPYFKNIITNVRNDIEVGSSLSAAFAKYPRVFDTLFISMVKVGEAGGLLSSILDRIAGYMEKTIKLQRKIKSAMVYPTVVVCMAFLITLFLLYKVVPTFVGIFESLGSGLPTPTKILIAISDIVRKGIFWIFGGIFSSIMLFKYYSKTEVGALQIDRLKLKLPVFGDLIRKISISRFSRTLATLTQSGVPILASLDIVSKTCGNKVLEIAVNNVKNNVREGENIAPPLIKSGVFPPMVTRMISVGEKTGELEKMLVKIAEFYDDQVDAAVTSLTSLIEPVIIGFLGIVIGGIVVSLFMPIMQMTTMIK